MMKLLVILYLVNFIKTVFYIVVFYYLIKWITRGFSKYFGNQSGQKNFQNQSGSGQPRRPNQRPEGDIRVENPRNYDSRIPRDEGEYVDFEEID